MKSKQDAVAWLKYRYSGEFSELGITVAWFLDKMWRLHNINSTSLSKVDWSNDTWIEITCDKPLATVDNSDLTRLVVIAHQMMLRIELRGIGPGYIKLKFHQRTGRNLEKVDFNQWCPTIEDHVQAITQYHPTVEEAI